MRILAKVASAASSLGLLLLGTLSTATVYVFNHSVDPCNLVRFPPIGGRMSNDDCVAMLRGAADSAVGPASFSSSSSLWLPSTVRSYLYGSPPEEEDTRATTANGATTTDGPTPEEALIFIFTLAARTEACFFLGTAAGSFYALLSLSLRERRAFLLPMAVVSTFVVLVQANHAGLVRYGRNDVVTHPDLEAGSRPFVAVWSVVCACLWVGFLGSYAQPQSGSSKTATKVKSENGQQQKRAEPQSGSSKTATKAKSENGQQQKRAEPQSGSNKTTTKVKSENGQQQKRAGWKKQGRSKKE